MNQSQLWALLSNTSLVSGEEPAAGELDSPWYISVLMGFLGWLAALFLLGFVGLGIFSVIESKVASFIVGILMIGGAYLLLQKNQAIFAEYFSLAISLAGQVLVLWSLLESSGAESRFFWLAMMVLQISIAALMLGAVHRVFSAYFACFAFIAFLILSGAQNIGVSIILFGVVWLWLNEFRYTQYMAQIRTMGYGLVLALISIKGALITSTSSSFWWGYNRQPEIWIQPWVGQLLSGFVLLYLVWGLRHQSSSAISQWSNRLIMRVYFAVALIAAISFEAPGIIIGVAILLLGFAGSNRVLTGLGCVSLLLYISAYYYQLHNTLLDKSLSLLALSIVLLGCRYCLNRRANSRRHEASEGTSHE
jgi:uncharacterized membrane protein